MFCCCASMCPCNCWPCAVIWCCMVASWRAGKSELQLAPAFEFPFGHFFPTCQVRVVRFYQCACPPPLPPPPRLAVLLALLLASASSTSTSALPTLPTRSQALRQLPSSVRTAGPQPGPAQLSVHRWTSTCELPSSVCTAGPQPGTCPAQCAPLDLNRRPSQLSVHRWTSTAR